ncbi:MAG: haloacid dehalogenase [Deltaproteobacteria bacterium]|nr:haloacid dehalogenase [Deltaproteobacteria bacterium]RLB32060.1 MAG: haloacid dehalogenase [Deltaproteobacteria bacterium]
MIDIAVPGRGHYSIENLVLDLNGTIALDGKIIGGVKERLITLSKDLTIIVVTADTNKNANKLLKGLPVTVCTIEESRESEQKARLVREKGEEVTVCVGNGSNDVSMLRESVIGICIVGQEGASSEAMMAADLVVPSINDALELFLKPHRMKASLRR